MVEATTGILVQSGLDEAYLQLSLVDGRKLEAEGEREEALERCQLLVNKAGQPLLAHGRSGAYTDDKAVVVPMIAGQAMLPDLKVTDSSEALLTGRAPPFRLLARVVQRGGYPFPGIAPVLSEPFVVATARVKGAAKTDIPHVDDHVSKLEGLGIQTQRKLEDIAAAAVTAGVPNLQVPINCVTRVGQFRDLVESAEHNKPLRETLKQVLRLTKGWDVARDHVRKAVHTDVQLRVFHPEGRTDVGLVFKCGAFNVVDISRPVGLLRRRRTDGRTDQELVDVVWLDSDPNGWPEAVRRIVPRAGTAWWYDGHPGWAFLPLATQYIPSYGENGKPLTQMSSYSFTFKSSPPVSRTTAGDRMSPGNTTQTQSNQQSAALLLSGLSPMGIPFIGQENNAGGTSQGMVPSSPPANGFPHASFPQVPLASLGFRSGGSIGGPESLATLPGAPPGSGANAADSLSPFEDPVFQHLMQLVAANGTDGTANLSMPPGPGGSDSGGTGSKGKRKADASLETWMALHKSLDYDFDLPSTLGGIGGGESLLLGPGSSQGRNAVPAPGTGPRTIVGGSMSLTPSLAIPMIERDTAGGGPLVPFAEFAAAVQRQRTEQRVGVQSGGVTTSAEEGRSNGGAAADPIPPPDVENEGGDDDAPAKMPEGVTMGQLRAMFAKAVGQEIPFSEVESFLLQHGLLSSPAENRAAVSALETAGVAEEDKPDGGGLGDQTIKQEMPAPAEAGLDDMRTIETMLPQYG